MIDRIPQPHHIVNEVMRRWPETVWLFRDYGMTCQGCPVGSLHTVEDAALEYRIPLQTFLSELRVTVAEGYKRSTANPKPRAANKRQTHRPQADARPSAPRKRGCKGRQQRAD